MSIGVTGEGGYIVAIPTIVAYSLAYPRQVQPVVIVLGEVTPADAAQLGKYPTVKFMNDPGDLESIYMVPPVQYPDGCYYIKMGANTTHDVFCMSPLEWWGFGERWDPPLGEPPA